MGNIPFSTLVNSPVLRLMTSVDTHWQDPAEIEKLAKEKLSQGGW
jgi:hypothetical protein